MVPLTTRILQHWISPADFSYSQLNHLTDFDGYFDMLPFRRSFQCSLKSTPDADEKSEEIHRFLGDFSYFPKVLSTFHLAIDAQNNALYPYVLFSGGSKMVQFSIKSILIIRNLIFNFLIWLLKLCEDRRCKIN